MQISRLLLIRLVAAIGTTAGLIVTIITLRPPPPPPSAGLPPPPQQLGVLIIVVGLFALTWLATVVVYSRDQVLHRFGEVLTATARLEADQLELGALLGVLRGDLAEDRQAALSAVTERLHALAAEYGEQRETDGYVKGMRIGAELGGPPNGELRTLRRVPPMG